MKKTALFFNSDYHVQRPVSFRDACDLSWNRIADIFYGKYRFYRQNLGTFLFTDTLAKTVDADWVRDYFWRDVEKSDLPKSVVTTLFHSISQHTTISDSLWDILRKTDMNLALLSCGINMGYFSDVELGGETRNFLHEVSQRNSIACRGDATAGVLWKYGIKNTRIVGCPSLFHHLDRNFRIEKKNINAVSRVHGCAHHYHDGLFDYFRHLSGRNDLSLSISLQQDFYRCMFGKPFEPDWASFSYFDTRKYHHRIEFLKRHGVFYFSVDDWIHAIKAENCEFSIGSTFHGNVAAVLAGVPALWLTNDTRMEELCAHHALPFIRLRNFDPSKPLEYYYELADYTEFNKKYSKNYDAYMAFCHENNVTIKSESPN